MLTFITVYQNYIWINIKKDNTRSELLWILIKIFSVWLRNWLISDGLEPVLSYTEKSFSPNVPRGQKTGINCINLYLKLSMIREITNLWVVPKLFMRVSLTWVNHIRRRVPKLFPPDSCRTIELLQHSVHQPRNVNTL